MGGELIGAFFFIRLDRRPPTDEELFDRLGCDRVTSGFGPLTVADSRVDVLSNHVCAQLYFLEASLRNLRLEGRTADESLDRDPALPFAIEFRDGAARADADVAILATHDPSLESILELYGAVQIADATSLAAERFGLLYLDDSQILAWSPPEHLLDRDKLPGGPGLTLFAGRGRSRWY